MTPPTEQYTIKQRLQNQEAEIDFLRRLITQDDTFLFSDIWYAEQEWGIEPEWSWDGKEEGTRYEQWKIDRIDFDEGTDPSNLGDSYLDSVRDEADGELRYTVMTVRTPRDDAQYVAMMFCCGGPHVEINYFFHLNGKPYRIEFYHSWTDGDTTISIPRDSETWLWLWDFMMGENPFENFIKHACLEYLP